jgi:hypothetical protein
MKLSSSERLFPARQKLILNEAATLPEQQPYVHHFVLGVPAQMSHCPALPALGELSYCGYDVGMVRRFRFLSALLLLSLCSLSGCKPKGQSKPITVHVLRDLRSIYGSELDHRILEFQVSNPHVSSGRPISVRSVEAPDYHLALQQQPRNPGEDVDLIILNAPDDASVNVSLQAQLPSAVNICAGVRACPANVPALIPPNVGGETREAAQMFVNVLQKNP